MPPVYDVLVIFARAPEIGRVKTRLAAGMGDRRALEIYRELAEGVVAAVRGTTAEIVVAYAPPTAADAMRAWLGSDLAYEPQVEGDLGERMAAAISSRLTAGAGRVVVIGADCPAVDAGVVARAFHALDDYDVVLGPAEDGGYYLVGTRSAHAALFRDIPWSSDRTLEVTLERIAQAALRCQLLDTLRDVDTAPDWRAYDRSRGGSGR